MHKIPLCTGFLRGLFYSFLSVYFAYSFSSLFMSMASGGEGSSTPTHRGTNRLAKERSPYLLQHAHNPVDWWVPLMYTFLRDDVVHVNVLCIIGIHGDKRLLTKRGMRISQSFYQVRAALNWQEFFVSLGMFSLNRLLYDPQWATQHATGVTLWKESLLRMKKLAKSWVTTLFASSWTEKRDLMWTRSTWPLFRCGHFSWSSCI